MIPLRKLAAVGDQLYRVETDRSFSSIGILAATHGASHASACGVILAGTSERASKNAPLKQHIDDILRNAKFANCHFS
jgi:hypothetical protein